MYRFDSKEIAKQVTSASSAGVKARKRQTHVILRDIVVRTVALEVSGRELNTLKVPNVIQSAPCTA